MLKPVILIHVYDKQGALMKFETMPYKGSQDELTDKLDKILEETNGSYVLPVTGFEKI